MRYVAVLVIIIAFVRIDFLLELFDRAAARFGNKTASQEFTSEDVRSSLETIPLKEDRNLRQTSKGILISLLEDFQVNPTADLRNRAMEYLRAQPAIFGPKLDRDLEVAVYKWREHINNNEPELINFLIDLQSVLQGENLELIKRFFSLWMEINVDHFVAAYARTKDQTCSIASVFGDPIPEEEKLNEYYDREDAFRGFLAREKVDPAQRALAENCLTRLTLLTEALGPKKAQAPDEAPTVPSEGTTSP